MEPNTVEKVIDALKAIIRTALCQGFSKTSYLVTNHIKYIKNIRSADSPERYLSFVAKKIFPDEITVLRKFEHVRLRYKDDLLYKFEDLYRIYLELARENKIPQQENRKTVSETEADGIIAELLF